jgi:hypothetical protein
LSEAVRSRIRLSISGYEKEATLENVNTNELNLIKQSDEKLALSNASNEIENKETRKHLNNYYKQTSNSNEMNELKTSFIDLEVQI